MTDFDKLKNLLDEFGLKYTVEDARVGDKTVGKSLTLTVGNDFDDNHCEKIKGYSGFCTEFNFDLDDKFSHVGIWE